MSILDTIYRIDRLTPLGYAVLYGGLAFAAYKIFGKPAAAANPAASTTVQGLGSMVSVAAPNGLTTGTLTVYRGRHPMKIGEFGVDARGKHWALSRVIDNGGTATLVFSYPNGSQSQYQVVISRIRGLRVAKMPAGV